MASERRQEDKRLSQGWSHKGICGATPCVFCVLRDSRSRVAGNVRHKNSLARGWQSTRAIVPCAPRRCWAIWTCGGIYGSCSGCSCNAIVLHFERDGHLLAVQQYSERLLTHLVSSLHLRKRSINQRHVHDDLRFTVQYYTQAYGFSGMTWS
jgi:hypothetical protein